MAATYVQPAGMLAGPVVLVPRVAGGMTQVCAFAFPGVRLKCFQLLAQAAHLLAELTNLSLGPSIFVVAAITTTTIRTARLIAAGSIGSLTICTDA